MYSTQEEDTLEIVLIDKFIVPEGSKARFLEEVHKNPRLSSGLCQVLLRALSTKKQTARAATTL